MFKNFQKCLPKNVLETYKSQKVYQINQHKIIMMKADNYEFDINKFLKNITFRK